MPQKHVKPAADRRLFIKTALCGGAAATLIPLYPAMGAARELAGSTPASDVKPFELDEITIADLQDGMKSGKFTAHSIAEKYLAHIDDVDKRGPSINAIIELNPDALAIADALDQERKAKGPRG